MSNKKIVNKLDEQEKKVDESYFEYKVTPKDSSQYYNAKEVKVEKIVIKFK